MAKQQQLTDKQRCFIFEYLKDKKPAEAARRAGYKDPDTYGNRLLDAKYFPLVKAAVDGQLVQLEQKSEKKASDILRYIHTAMFVNMLDWFEPGEEGGWYISNEALKSLPPEIGCLIEEIESKTTTTTTKGGVETTETKLKLKMVSKTAMTALAAKHQLTQNITVAHYLPDWDGMLQRAREKRALNPAVAKMNQILAAKNVPENTVDMGEQK